jgi:hypothetical protein
MENTLKIILKRLRANKRKYNSKDYGNERFGYLGLCDIVYTLQGEGKLTRKEHNAFKLLLYTSHKDQSIFWDSDNGTTLIITQFHWRFGVYAPRERWLVEQLELHRKKK